MFKTIFKCLSSAIWNLVLLRILMYLLLYVQILTLIPTAYTLICKARTFCEPAVSHRNQCLPQWLKGRQFIFTSLSKNALTISIPLWDTGGPQTVNHCSYILSTHVIKKRVLNYLAIKLLRKKEQYAHYVLESKVLKLYFNNSTYTVFYI